MKNEFLILIPTYNEISNVERILSQILVLNLPADILFTDDNSPDGTGNKLEQLSEKHQNILIRHRKKKLGIGSAHIDGINFAYDQGYRLLVTMDCDFSHSPREIKEFIRKAEQADIVIGSRFIMKGGLKEWNIIRKFLTHVGHIATQLLLRIPHDATGAFRLYRIDRISRNFIDKVNSKGYSFFFESLYVLNLNGYKILEIPIKLPARVYGNSKMRIIDVIHSLFFLVKIYFRSEFNYKQNRITETIVLEPSKLINDLGWDEYWENKNRKRINVIYHTIANLYREFIIRPFMNGFIFYYFKNHDNLLHAGCGGGKVDIKVSKEYNITAIDISRIALKKYIINNPNVDRIIHGSIFSVPVKDSIYDGIYNLGVMEHYKEEEIAQILNEFKRVLKSNGKIILFWPTEYSLSVIFLKLVNYFFRFGLKKNIILYPPEVTRIKSVKHIQDICRSVNIHLENYYFCASDLFTHGVVVLTNNKYNK